MIQAIGRTRAINASPATNGTRASNVQDAAAIIRSVSVPAGNSTSNVVMSDKRLLDPCQANDASRLKIPTLHNTDRIHDRTPGHAASDKNETDTRERMA